MNASSHYRPDRLLVGACDWRDPAWVGGYYPADLPEDWRLGFYANEFQCVLVPGDFWDADSGQWGAQAGRLRDDATPGFGFFLAPPATLRAAEDARAAWGAALASLGETALAVLVPMAGYDEADLAALRACLPASLPVIADFDGPPPALAGRLAERGYGICWHGPGEPLLVGDGPIVLARCATGDLRALRAVIEGCVQAAGSDRQPVLLLDGAPPPKLLRDALVLAELLAPAS